MSSEENKFQSEAKIKNIQKGNFYNSDSSIIQEENLSKEKQTEHDFVKSFEQKLDNPTTKNASNEKDFTSPKKLDSKNPNLNSSLSKNKKVNFFRSNKINSFDKKESTEKLFCNCTKTRCIKKYCECFANNRLCNDCNCVNCLNTNSNSNNNNSKDLSEKEEIFCTCTKSNCNKKYCECFKFGKKCNDKCRCSNCLNSACILFKKKKDNDSKENLSWVDNNNLKELNDNKTKIDLDEKKSNSRKSSPNDDSNQSYQIQRISIFINQIQTLVNVEKFSKQDMKLLSKKRFESQ